MLRSPHIRKNIVLITFDGLRSDHLSCYGYTRKTSPNIDSLANNGTLFEQIITSGSSTKAALTSLFTSLDFRYHKMIEHESILDDNFVTLAEVFKNQGYTTIGFTATPMIQKAYNYNQGFDFYEDYIVKGKEYNYVYADIIIRDLFSWLDRYDYQKPFFCYIHFVGSHPPWIRESPWLYEKEDSKFFFDTNCTYIPSEKEVKQIGKQKLYNLIAKYDGSILYNDSYIGKLIDKLKNNGLNKNTIVAISADHGYELLDHGTGTHGYCPYDEVIKIPLIIYDGTMHNKPKKIQSQGRNIDIGPTLLDMVGLEAPEVWEGISLLKKKTKKSEFAFTMGYNVQSVRTSQYKLIYQDIKSVNNNYWKSPGYELYNLISDPKELKDISSLNLPIYFQLKKELSLYMEDIKNNKFMIGSTIPKNAQLDEVTVRRLRALGYIK